MRIIEKSTGKQIDFLEKINKSTWRKWIWGAVVLLLLVVGILFVVFYNPVFSTFDYIGIGFFILVLTYYLVRIQRMK